MTEEFTVEVASEKHLKYVDEILQTITDATKVRGTGIAKRKPEYVQKKMLEGKAIIAMHGDDFAGFCYIESWDNEEFVANSGLIVKAEYRGHGLAKRIIQIRSTIVLPAGLGKEVRVCVIAKGPKATEAKSAGADEAGAEEIIEKIEGGWFEFDTLIATPDCMGMLGKLGRVLGPKGLMPNPKTGTVTMDVANAVKDAKAGKVEFRADKQGMIHCPIGKIKFSEDDLVKNFATLTAAILKAKPSSAKGTCVKSAYLATTMGPGIKLDSKNLATEVKEELA